MTSLDPAHVKNIVLLGHAGSGKTTLARLLQRIFNGAKTPDSNLNTFIIHEDDFYFPDDK